MKWNLIPMPKSITSLPGTARNPAVREVIDPAMEKEHYRIRITEEEAVLTAGSETGIVWAKNTLDQLSRQFPEALPCVEIQDGPEYGYRAFHMDSARHMRPVEEMKKIITRTMR